MFSRALTGIFPRGCVNSRLSAATGGVDSRHHDLAGKILNQKLTRAGPSSASGLPARPANSGAGLRLHDLDRPSNPELWQPPTMTRKMKINKESRNSER